MARLVHLPFALGMALAAVSPARPQGVPEQSGQDRVSRIRAEADGGGPSHLFWLAHGEPGSEIVGIVDPLYAAIRLYAVSDADATHGAIQSRLIRLGACALPVSFRPWRIHQLKRRVLIESMPEPGSAGYLVKPAALETRMFRMRRGLVTPASLGRLRLALAALDSPRWNPATAPSCGSLMGKGPMGVGASVVMRRGLHHAARTITIEGGPAALAPRARLTVRSGQGYRLLSVRELEPARARRVIQTSEQLPGADGVVHVRQRLIITRRNGQVVRYIDIVGGELAGKSAFRDIAVLPTGEILALGKRFVPGRRPDFALFSCGLITESAPAAGGSCVKSEGPLPRAMAGAASQRTLEPSAWSSPRSLNARSIFDLVRPLLDIHWSVDTRNLPEPCRSATGCPVPDQRPNFVPLRGIRLTRGTYQQTGAPYAQTESLADFDRLRRATAPELSAALAHVMEGKRGWPGNLADGLRGDLGIDCSALLQIAWGRREAPVRWSTATITNFADAALCTRRLPSPDWLRAGDAIGLRTGETNHVMLFAEPMRIDGANIAWLVLESSSSCDGVCWSVYDPSILNGWSLYRAAGRSDVPCPRRSQPRTMR